MSYLESNKPKRQETDRRIGYAQMDMANIDNVGYNDYRNGA
jgi:hypothetical protein